MIFSCLSHDDLERSRLTCKLLDQNILRVPSLHSELFLDSAPVERRLLWKRVEGDVEYTPHIIGSDAPNAGSGLVIAKAHPRLVRSSSMKTQLELSFPSLDRMLFWPEDAKCVQTFLTQPPCTVIHIHGSMPLPDNTNVGTIEVPSGYGLERLRKAVGRYTDLIIKDGQRSRRISVVGTVAGFVEAGSEFVAQAEKEFVDYNQSEKTKSGEMMI